MLEEGVSSQEENTPLENQLLTDFNKQTYSRY